jgi:hypothetical protein
VVGLDTVRLRVPTDGHTQAAWDLAPTRRGEGFFLPGGGEVYLADGKAFIEVSVARREYGDNVVPLSVADLPLVLADLLYEVDTYFPVRLDDVELADVLRLDVVVNFSEVQMIPALLDGLAGVPRDRRLRVTREADGRGQTNMLIVRTKRAWSASLYDKYLESNLASATRILRYECRLRQDRLRQAWATRHGGKIGVVADITEAKLESLAHATFCEVGFDMAVVAPMAAVAEVMNMEISATKKATLLGKMMAEASGFQLEFNDSTERQYRKLERELGVKLTLPDTPTDTMRLDWNGTASQLLAA